MAYEKTEWISGETPLSADNLNKIENELEVLDTAAQRTNHILDMVRCTRFQKANVSISANSTASVEMSYTVPTGFNLGTAIAIRFDSEGTTSSENATYCVSPNYWVGSDGKLHAAVRNLASSAAKVTVHWYILFLRNTL